MALQPRLLRHVRCREGALIWSGAPIDPAVVKTHSGLISAFSLHLVKTGRLPVELGRSLNWAAEIRLIADYSGDVVTTDKAQQIIEQADFFVATVRKQLEPHTLSGVE